MRTAIFFVFMYGENMYHDILQENSYQVNLIFYFILFYFILFYFFKLRTKISVSVLELVQFQGHNSTFRRNQNNR